MNKKFFSMIAGSALAAVLIAGCGINNNDQEPPPENDVNEPGVNDNGNGNDMNNNGVNGNDNLNNNNNDINTDNDGDMMKDDNAPGEDLIEDRRDREDPDNKDR